MSIYKPCDIRGHVGSELTADLYRTWGSFLGRQVKAKSKFVVGGDGRRSTPEFLSALADGLCESGVDVVDVGIIPTAMIYYAKRRLQAEGCAIVTASRHAGDINGLKWMVGNRPPTIEDVRKLREEAEESRRRRSRRQAGSQREIDISFDYVAWLQETWVDSMDLERRIVVDPLFSCMARRARRYLQAVFPRSLFLAIHDEPDPDLAGRYAGWLDIDRFHDLAMAVEHERADLGIAFDGDRLVFVDNEGSVLTAKETASVFLQSLEDEARGQSFVYDLKFSQRLPELAQQLGMTAVPERSGHTFLHTRMLETGSLFGAEHSGHFFFRAIEGGHDSVFGACWLIAWLAHCGLSLSELRRRCPAAFITPDLRIRADADHQKVLLGQIRAAWSDRPQSFLDGVRIEFPNGWALVRSSVTESSLCFRFESNGWNSLRDLVWRFCKPLADLGDEIWMQYTAVLGNPELSETVY